MGGREGGRESVEGKSARIVGLRCVSVGDARGRQKRRSTLKSEEECEENGACALLDDKSPHPTRPIHPLPPSPFSSLPFPLSPPTHPLPSRPFA
eukprot:3940681-Rhodomonas_salina.4